MGAGRTVYMYRYFMQDARIQHGMCGYRGWSCFLSVAPNRVCLCIYINAHVCVCDSFAVICIERGYNISVNFFTYHMYVG